MILESVFGAITGLLGSAVTSYFNWKQQKLKNDHDIQMKELDIKLVTVEADKKMEISRVETEGKIELSELDAYKMAQEESNKSSFDSSYMKYLMESKYFQWLGALIAGAFGFVEWLKGMARPAITYYLLGVSTYLTILCYKLLQTFSVSGAITLPEAYDIFQLCIRSLIYLTISCVSFWFCDRRVAKFLYRLNDSNKKD